MSNKNVFRAFIRMNLQSTSVQREDRAASLMSFYKRHPVPWARGGRINATSVDEDEAEDPRNRHRQRPVEHGVDDDQKTN